MPLPIENSDKFYWQALGVIKGTLRKEKSITRKKDVYSILYRGREYPVFSSRRRFEERKNFDLDQERLYMIYPTPKAKKPIHLIKEDHGERKAKAIALIPNGIRALFDADPYAKKLLRRQIGLMKPGVIDGIFTIAKKYTAQEEAYAAGIFNVLKEILVERNDDLVSDEGIRIAFSILGLLNHAFCDQLYHPDSNKPDRSFLCSFFRSSKMSRESKRQGVLFDTLSFSLVGYSESENGLFLNKEGQPLEEQLADGEFLLSGAWKPWKRDATKATFSCHLNERTDRDLATTPMGCEKKKKLTIFLNKEDPQLMESCYGKAIAKLIPAMNVFSVNEFRPCEEMHPILSPKALNASRKEASKQKREEKKAKTQNKTNVPSLNKDLGAIDNFDAVKDADTIDNLGRRRRKVGNQGLLHDKATKAQVSNLSAAVD